MTDTTETFEELLAREYPGLSVESAKSALSNRWKSLQDEQQRNADLLAMAVTRELDPKFKDLFDIKLPDGFWLKPKTLDYVAGAETQGETIYRLVPPEGATIASRYEAVTTAKALGINIIDRQFPGGIRQVADMGQVRHFVLRHHGRNADYKTRVLDVSAVAQPSKQTVMRAALK